MQKFIVIMNLLFTLVASCLAGVTGKIAGTVTDLKTGQPLSGVNVLIEGMAIGAATDSKGDYVILNISAGTYRLRASMIGYALVIVENVGVSIDLTTTVDFSLSREVLEGESITVVAERPFLRNDEFTSRHILSSEDIVIQPIDDFMGIAMNQAGAVGGHFRGGRSGEILVLIDGLPVRDPAGSYSGDLGGFTADVPEYGIQELEVSLGGFSAEYGNVQSGILNLAMKEGSRHYHGMIKYTSSDFGPNLNNKLMGKRKKWLQTTYKHQLKNIYHANLSGPEPLTTYVFPMIGLDLPGSINFSLSAETTDRKQGYFINQQSLTQSYQGKLTYRISPKVKLAFGGLFSSSNWDQFYFPASKYGPAPDYPVNEHKEVRDSTLYHYIYVDNAAEYDQGLEIGSVGALDGDAYDRIRTYYVSGMQEYLWDRHQNSNLAYMVWTHSLSSRTFYEVRAEQFYTNYHYATPDVEDRDGDGDTEEDLVWDITKPGPWPTYREREINYWWVRGDDPGFRDQSSWTQTIKTDLVSQLTKNHLLKGGLELSGHRTRVENISWTLNLGSVRKDIWNEDAIDFSVYLQDKMEFEGIIALVGLRYDYFNPNGWKGNIYYPADYNYPYSEVDEDDVPILIEPKRASIRHQISPRIGMSHPITDRDVLHFTYGHYFQRPDGLFLYRNHRIQALTKTGNSIGNPDLKPEKTVSYEVGVEHLFTSDIKGTITGYNKDVSNLMNRVKYVGRSIQDRELNVFINADYGNIKGLELTLSKRLTRFWGGSVNYAYSIAKGRSSSTTSGYGSFTDAKRMNILDFDQTHTVNGNITLRTADRFGPRIGGFQPLSNWLANIQFEYGSGLPYSSYGSGKINDKRLPWTSTTDVKIIRKIEISPIYLDIFIDVFNLFDRKNVRWIGNRQYYEIEGDASIMTKDDVTGEYIRNPQVYSSRRQVRFGLAVRY